MKREQEFRSINCSLSTKKFTYIFNEIWMCKSGNNTNGCEFVCSWPSACSVLFIINL